MENPSYSSWAFLLEADDDDVDLELFFLKTDVDLELSLLGFEFVLAGTAKSLKDGKTGFFGRGGGMFSTLSMGM